jgi:DNA-binding HxlR family transcriptional regulator
VDVAFRLLGRRWGPEVLVLIAEGAKRYGELLRALPGISPRTLSLRVSEFQRAEIISKTANGRERVTYKLTRKGRELVKELESIADFSIRWHKAS